MSRNNTRTRKNKKAGGRRLIRIVLVLIILAAVFCCWSFLRTGISPGEIPGRIAETAAQITGSGGDEEAASDQEKNTANVAQNSAAKNASTIMKNLGVITAKAGVKAVNTIETSQENAETKDGSLAKMNYTGKAYVAVNKGKPEFTSEQIRKARHAYKKFGSFDRYYRATAAICSLTESTMPSEDVERGDISSVHPSGWRSGQGWERCHLIGWQLSGENANPYNLITGTRYFNVTGMLPFENSVAHYLRKYSGNHVLYRVTPVYRGKEQIARGVQMEGKSVENNQLSFNIYVFNVQPGEKINYKNGEVNVTSSEQSETAGKKGQKRTYLLNTNTKRFHYPSCGSGRSTLQKNRKTVTTTRKALIQQGYTPCGNCQP